MAAVDGPNTPRIPRLLKLTLDPIGYMEQYRQQYGPIFKVGRQPPYLIYIGDPQALQVLFAQPPEQFATDASAGNLLKTLLGDHSVLLLDGDRHRRQRQLLMPPFHGDRLRTYGELMVTAAEQVCGHWRSQQPFRVRPPMQAITLRVILKAVFGVSEGERFDQFCRFTSALLDTLSGPLRASLIFFPILRQDWGSWTPWGQFLAHKRRVDALIYAEIQDRRMALAQQQPLGDDILSLLMTARDQAGQGMSDVELHDELMTLLLAGHETTASALSWALYWTHSTPGVEEKLRRELASVSQPSAVVKLPYLTAVCQEALRLYPVALTTGVRVLRSPLTLGGYDLAAGSVLFPSIYLVHQNPEIYPEPQRFRPERFLEGAFSATEYLPFGGGHRYCIGAAMAMMEMKIVLATVLRRWQLRGPDKPIRPVRRGLTLAPPTHLAMVPTPTPILT